MKSLKQLLATAIASVFFLPAIAQNDVGAYLQNQLSRANNYSMYTPQEKVYLHFDNTGYFQGETMHFKAYVIRTDTERLSNLSHVLYVDLITPNGDVVEQRKLMLNNGLARGDFKLDELLLTGFYEVRAYTRYMTNWGTDACFSRVLPIFKEPKEAGDYSVMELDEFSYNHRLVNRREEELKGDTLNSALLRKNLHRGVSIHFYPEGGNLVEGLESRVAYTVLDDNAEVLRGSITVTPNERQKVKVKYDKKTNLLTIDEKGKYLMPETLEEGVSLTMDVLGESYVTAELKSTATLQHETIGYALMHNGVIKHSETFCIENGKTLSFDRSSLDEGVNQLTIFNKDGHILAERLFFIFPKPLEKDSIRVTTSTQLLQPLKKVYFDIQARPYSSLSFSAIDAANMTGGKQGNIRTNLLLSSDLRGYVAHPEYYLESDDEEHRKASDLLMLVQGWRRYDWQEMIGVKPLENRQPIEDRLAIYGKIVPRKKKLVNEGMELSAIMYDHQGQCLEGEFITGENGSYLFDLPDITGDWILNLYAKKEGEIQNFNICIDRNFTPDCRYISPDESVQFPVGTPNFAWGDDETVTIDGSAHVHRYLLPEVQVKKRSNKYKGWTDETYASSTSVVRYDCEKEADKLLDEGKLMMGFEEWLVSLGDAFFTTYCNYYDDTPVTTSMEEESNTFQPVTHIHSEGLGYYGRPILWIINNQFWGITNYSGVEPKILYNDNKSGTTTFPIMLDEVKSVYISEDVQSARKHFYSPTFEAYNPVVFYCYARKLNKKALKKGERVTHFQGFDVPTYFEMDYSNFQPLQDVRRTLHWSSLTTDAEGKAHVEFYNNINCTNMIVTVEGISIDGHIQTN